MDGRLSTIVRCRYIPRSFTLTTATGALVSIRVTPSGLIKCDDADIYIKRRIMCHLSREVSLNPLLKVKDSSQLVMATLGLFHIHSPFAKDRTLMLGSSNCSCQENRSIYHMLLNHRHLKLSPLAVAVRLQLYCLNRRICIYPGTLSKFPWSSDVQTSHGTGGRVFITTSSSYYITS
jgi:hypothetical protein